MEEKGGKKNKLPIKDNICRPNMLEQNGCLRRSCSHHLVPSCLGKNSYCQRRQEREQTNQADLDPAVSIPKKQDRTRSHQHGHNDARQNNPREDINAFFAVKAHLEVISLALLRVRGKKPLLENFRQTNS